MNAEQMGAGYARMWLNGQSYKNATNNDFPPSSFASNRSTSRRPDAMSMFVWKPPPHGFAIKSTAALIIAQGQAPVIVVPR